MKLRFFKSNKVFTDTSDSICSICLDTICSDKLITNCGHCFHTKCLGKSLKISSKCPYCRSTIRKINYSIKLKKNCINQFKKIKRFLENNVEYLLENHMLLSFTICLPILYVSMALCVLCFICEMIANLFVNNNEEVLDQETEINFVSV
jgi:hypothetical protein